MNILKTKLTLKGKLIIAVLLLIMFVGGGTVAYQVHDFTQNNPKFCVSCHLMQDAYDAWDTSVHQGINCHECHYATPAEQNRMLFMTLVKNPQEVEYRHGKVIVSYTYCYDCHWESKPGFEKAPNIAKSQGHAKHVFIEQIECSKCHGYIEEGNAGVHDFLPSDRFCVKCHEGTEVHGRGMDRLACLACHTDQTEDIRPNRDKCLTCHGDAETRARIAKLPMTVDTKHFSPDPEQIEKASAKGVVFPEEGSMHFECQSCHKAHGKIKPDESDCLNCHIEIKKVGQHGMHIDDAGADCTTCHKPHQWKVTKEAAQEICTMCHDYQEPDSFFN